MTNNEIENKVCKACDKQCLYQQHLKETGDEIKAALIAGLIIAPFIVGMYFLLQWLLPPELWERVLDILKWA